MSAESEAALSRRPFYAKEYVSRCRLRTIKHFSLADDEDWKECIGDAKTNLSHHAPYRKDDKIFRSVRKARRKSNKGDPKEALFSLIDLDNLAKSLTDSAADSIVDGKRIDDLFSRIQSEIYKYKSEFGISSPREPE